MEIGRYIRNGTAKEMEWLEKVAGIFGSTKIAGKDICVVPKEDDSSSREKLLWEFLDMEKEEDAAYGMIVKHLFCYEDYSLHERISLEQKSLKECMEYLFGQAWKRANQGRCSCASEEEVFGWARDYFLKEEIPEQEYFRGRYGGTQKSGSMVKSSGMQATGTKKGKKAVQAEKDGMKNKMPAQKPAAESQMSLFDLYGME